MPIPLLICAEFLYSNRLSPGPFSARLEELIAILRRLKNVNDPSQNYVDLLQLSCVAASRQLGREAAHDAKQSTPGLWHAQGLDS